MGMTGGSLQIAWAAILLSILLGTGESAADSFAPASDDSTQKAAQQLVSMIKPAPCGIVRVFFFFFFQN